MGGSDRNGIGGEGTWFGQLGFGYFFVMNIEYSCEQVVGETGLEQRGEVS